MEDIRPGTHVELRAPGVGTIYLRKGLWEMMLEKVRRYNNGLGGMGRQMSVGDVLNPALAIGLLGQSEATAQDKAAREQSKAVGEAKAREARRGEEEAAANEKNRLRRIYESRAAQFAKSIKRGDVQPGSVAGLLDDADKAGVGHDGAFKAIGLDAGNERHARFIEAVRRLYDRRRESAGRNL